MYNASHCTKTRISKFDFYVIIKIRGFIIDELIRKLFHLAVILVYVPGIVEEGWGGAAFFSMQRGRMMPMFFRVNWQTQKLDFRKQRN